MRDGRRLPVWAGRTAALLGIVLVAFTLRTAVGVLAVDAVDVVPRATAAEARRAGYPTPAALKSEVDARPGDLYRIALRSDGSGVEEGRLPALAAR